MKRPPVSRADLVRCLAVGEDCLAAAAVLLGFRPVEARPPPKPHGIPVVEVEPVEPAREEAPPAAAGVPDEPFWQQVVFERRAAQLAARVGLPAALPLNLADPMDGNRPPPPPGRPVRPPLMRWSRLWPLLRQALGAWVPSSRVHVRPLVRAISRGQAIRAIPRLPRCVWAPRAQLVLDWSQRTMPFWEDLLDLCRRVRRWRGGSALDVVYLPDGPDGPACRRGGSPSQPYEPPSADVPVLALSDLGCLDGPRRAAWEWARLGRRLGARGHRPTALAPCPRWRWSPAVAAAWRMACWDRGQALPVLDPRARRGLRPQGEARPDDPGRTERLLALASPAVRVEPALLRALRLLLPRCQQDVGTEADAWRHPDVIGLSPVAMWIDPKHVDGHRERFAHMASALGGKVLALLHTHHHADWFVGELLATEVYILRELGVEEPALTNWAQGFFERVARTFRDLSFDRLREGNVFAWFDRTADRLPAGGLRRDEIAASCALSWQRRTEGAGREALPVPDGASLWRPLASPPPTPPRNRWLLRQVGPCLQVETAEPLPGELGHRPGSPLAQIAGNEPIVSVSLLHDSPGQPSGTPEPPRRTVLLDIANLPAPPVRLPRSGRVVVASDRQRVELAALPAPHWASGIGRDRFGLYADLDVRGVAHRLRWIPPGRFRMGSPEDEAERDDDEVLHWVTLTRGFWLGATACTQALWKAVMGENPSEFRSPDRPVEQVSWEDCQPFFERLAEELGGERFRLPTEAEWEYACRAGTQTPFSFGENITTDQANFDGNYPYGGAPKGKYRRETVDVRRLPPNAWGLYQMHGNVWEWCQDWYGEYPREEMEDPTGPAEGADRVVRGGGWGVSARHVRAAVRDGGAPGYRGDSLGFRLARGQ